MKFQLFTQVALRKDVPELNLTKGSIGTVVEHYSMLDGMEDGYSLEGLVSQDTVEVSESQIRALRLPERFTILFNRFRYDEPGKAEEKRQPDSYQGKITVRRYSRRIPGKRTSPSKRTEHK